MIKALLEAAIGRLSGVSDTPALDAQLLLMHVSAMERHHLITRSDEVLPDHQVLEFEALVERRFAGEPVAYLIGTKPFMGLDFEVGAGVLIPRPDTEILVEAILAAYPAGTDDSRLEPDSQVAGGIPGNVARHIRFAEIGTGSGAICVSLLVYRENFQGVGLEISQKAIEITSKNAYSNDVQNRLDLRTSDVFSALSPSEAFDFIVSNPPYISRADMALLIRDVHDFEPHLALFGGDDGLDFYRQITDQAPNFLVSGGRLFFEIGYDQGFAVSQMLTERGFCEVLIERDLAGHQRVVSGLWKE